MKGAITFAAMLFVATVIIGLSVMMFVQRVLVEVLK